MGGIPFFDHPPITNTENNNLLATSSLTGTDTKVSDQSKANGKRSWDESETPTVDPKRQKMNPQSGTDTKIVIGITTKNFRFVSPVLAAKIEQFLLDKIDIIALSKAKNKPRPVFSGRPRYQKGSFRLVCADEDTVQWVTNTVTTFENPDPLIVFHPNERSRNWSVGILLPTLETDFMLVMKRLQLANPWANTQEWLPSVLRPQGSGTLLRCSVYEENVAAIVARNRKMSYRLGTVYVKFRDARGQYGTTPWTEESDEILTDEATPLQRIEAAAKPISAEEKKRSLQVLERMGEACRKGVPL